MRYYTIILTMLFSSALLGQIKDRRAELDIQGRVNEISVSPDEKIWLVTAIGNTYYTDNIDSNWHYGKPLYEKDNDDFSINSPHLERISFFNKDTAIMTGYFSSNKNNLGHSGYYLTMDAGKTWNLYNYGGDSWIYNVFIDDKGNAWMGGSSGEIHFSNDFGQHWEKLNSPFNSFLRMHCIFMTSSSNGVSGALNNAIYTTFDNWKTHKEISTPYDHNKYRDKSDLSDNRIEKVLLWNNFIVVNQSGHIYYTDAEKVDWKPFPVKVIDFELDFDSKTLFAVTDSFKIVYFTSPTEYQFLTENKIPKFPIDLKVVNNSLYILSEDYNVYKVNKSGFKQAITYTSDKTISEPQIVKHGTNLTWGVNKKQIYLSGNTNDWYRENALLFDVSDFKLLNDSVVILWDGLKDNYLYSLKDHTPKKYFPESPLETFLTSPIKTFIINASSQGCYHSLNNEVTYTRVNDSSFVASKFTINQYSDKTTSTFENKLNGLNLSNSLISINSNPSAIPSLNDFQISEIDKKNYLVLVDKQFDSNEYEVKNGKKIIKREFYYSVLSMLDTLNSTIISDVLNKQELIWSTTSNWFTIQIVNSHNDTLNVSRNYFQKSKSWNLPWKFEYEGLNFNSYSIDFSKFIASSIPDKFMDKDVFDNRILIMQIADYLYGKVE